MDGRRRERLSAILSGEIYGRVAKWRGEKWEGMRTWLGSCRKAMGVMDTRCVPAIRLAEKRKRDNTGEQIRMPYENETETVSGTISRTHV